MTGQTTLLVVGAGIMGAGIAQIAAQAGHAVKLFDVEPGAAESAISKLQSTFEKLVAKGKFTSDAAELTLKRIEAVKSLDSLTNTELVIEAVVEDIDIKRSLFQQLETIVCKDCILATNTSSLSITAIGRDMQHPERLVGMHFFNPVPLMKLVEVVSGLQTSKAIANSIFELAKFWGKTPVHTRSTPGFIVNRIARPFYAETLALLQEQVAEPAVLDTCLRAAGFRMGPCELMDLIGHDTNLSVTQSVYQANYFDKRYVPSLVQQELVDGGLLGRKSGRGFYNYNNPETPNTVDFKLPESLPATANLTVHGKSGIVERITRVLDNHSIEFEQIADSDWCGLQVANAQLRLTDGRPASQLGTDIAVFDLPLNNDTGSTLAWSYSTSASSAWIDESKKWLEALGFMPEHITDAPGLVVARSVAMIINEAADAVHQGVCTIEATNAAMKLGVNYPAGPFEWLANLDIHAVIALIDRLDDYYRGERYRVSPWLRQRSWQENTI